MVRRVSWRSVTLLCAGIGCAAIAFYLLADYASWPRPRLVTESDQIDLGALDPGTSEFQFRVLNAGRGLLRIDEVKSSCGCTIVAQCDAIPAGMAGIITGNVTVGRGLGSSKLFLLSNDPDHVHAVNLTWFGKGPPVVIPSKMSVCLRPKERCLRRIRVVYPAGYDLVCQGVSNTKMDFHCEVVRDEQIHEQDKTPIEDARTETAMLALQFSAPERHGSYLVEPVLHLAQRQLTYQVPLSLEIDVIGRIHTIPRQIFFGAADPDSLVNRRVHLQVVSEGHATDISVLSKPDFLECRFRKIEDRLGDLEVRVASAPPFDARHFVISLGDSSANRLRYVAH